MLVLPAKVCDAQSAAGFEHRNVNDESVDFLVRYSFLPVRDRDQCAVSNRFNESVTQRVERRAKRSCLLRLGDWRTATDDSSGEQRRHAFLHFRTLMIVAEVRSRNTAIID